MTAWLFRNIAILIGWLVIIAGAGAIGWLLDIAELYLAPMMWLCIGGLVLAHRKIEYPVPSGDRIDIKGALAMFWWMAWWPRYLRGKGRG